MSSNKVNKTTGELVTLANGMRCWIGTKAAHDAAVQAGTMPNNCLVAIVDDWEDSTVDVVEDGNMHPVTSNAVSADLSPIQSKLNGANVIKTRNVSSLQAGTYGEASLSTTLSEEKIIHIIAYSSGQNLVANHFVNGSLINFVKVTTFTGSNFTGIFNATIYYLD